MGFLAAVIDRCLVVRHFLARTLLLSFSFRLLAFFFGVVIGIIGWLGLLRLVRVSILGGGVEGLVGELGGGRVAFAAETSKETERRVRVGAAA